MKIKIYNDETFNIFYEIGDFVKIKDDNNWGEVVRISGKPITAKLSINTDDGEIDEYVWNVVPVDENGVEITKEQLFKMIPVKENKNYKIEMFSDRTILKFEEFN
jgi:hypothetical protein